jgi:hypothetical protein
LDNPQNTSPVNVKKMTMLASYYSKIEIRLLMAIATVLIALLFAVSAARGASPKPAELTVIDETTGVWKTQSADGEGAFAAYKWGLEGDVRVPADYDGDGITDIAVWRPGTGNWHILRSSDGATLNIKWKQTGAVGDIPVPADFDGDKIADLAVWRPANGRWYVLTSQSGFSSSSVSALGSLGDIPVPADYDGDGRADAGIFRSSQNRWYIAESKTGKVTTRNFGIAGTDLLVPADYTGDGRADLAVFRSGVWYVQELSGGEIERFEFGFADSIPVPADYDGDGTTDFAVYRQGTWYFFDSGQPRLRSVKFGNKSEIPQTSLSVKPSVIAVR